MEQRSLRWIKFVKKRHGKLTAMNREPKEKTGMKPSADVEEKMQSISRQSFQALLQKAAKPPSRKPASKTK